ncbi:MAG: hypothetical protein M1356_09800 [Gammaproteobacteria bacterium]|nr:hypothetical protein [Gammaproteobacteria bacterium]
MPLLIKEFNEKSVLRSYDVKKGDYLAKINSWAVRSQDDMRIAYRSDHLRLLIRRDKQSFEVHVEASDLGILVEDENGEVFEVKRSEATGDKHNTASVDITSNSLSILKVSAWVLFFINLIASIYLMSTSLLTEIPGTFGSATKELNVFVLAIITVSIISSIFIVALAYALSHLSNHARYTSRQLVAIKEKLS